MLETGFSADTSSDVGVLVAPNARSKFCSQHGTAAFPRHMPPGRFRIGLAPGVRLRVRGGWVGSEYLESGHACAMPCSASKPQTNKHASPN